MRRSSCSASRVFSSTRSASIARTYYGGRTLTGMNGAEALHDAFERDGLVRVAGAIAPQDVRAMRDCARERIAGVEFVDVAGALRPERGVELALWEIGRAPAFAPLPDAFARAVDRVFGPGVWAQAD